MFKEFKKTINTSPFLQPPKNPLKGLVKKTKEKATEIVQESKDLVKKAATTVIAIEEAGVNIIRKKDVDNIASDFMDTIKSKDSTQAVKTVIEHQTAKKNLQKRGTEPLRKTISKTVAGDGGKLITNSVFPTLFILKGILNIFDARKSNRTDTERARKYARFAAHSYRDLEDCVLPDRCIEIDKITTKEKLKATVYNDNGDIVCAFAGTGKNVNDWKNNFTQLVGKSKQYEEALEFAKRISARFPNKRIIFVGHSKGGGEAAYCAYNLGMQAETYNPAGLSIFTTLKSTHKQGASINAYVFSTDILNAFQKAVGIETDGDVHYIPANPLEHGIHGILGILKYYKIKFKKKNLKKAHIIY